MSVPWNQDGYHNKALEPFDELKYEYEITEGPRKGHVYPPPGETWVEIDWNREDYIDRTLWRRVRTVFSSSIGNDRPAGLPASPASFDLLQHLRRQKTWSETTFGLGSRPQTIINHIRKELLEIESTPHEVEEWIDVVLLALDGAWRTGASPEAIVEALVAKQTKNESRSWVQPTSPDQPIEHDREQDALT